METLPVHQESRLDVNRWIAEAIQQKLPVETLERLFALAEKAQAQYAESEYVKALSSLQSEMPEIPKSKPAKNDEGKLYSYAPFNVIIKIAQPLLTKYGFSYSFNTIEEEDRLKVECIVHHIGGYKSSSYFSPRKIRITRAMNDAQQDGGTSTFAKRYAFCNAFGIVTADEDTDARRENVKIQSEELERLRSILHVLQIPEDQVAIKCQAESLEAITQDQALALIRSLSKKVQSNASKK